MVDATLATTLGFALTAGVVTFFSPCAYPLLPGYVGFYVSQTDGNRATLGGAFARGLVAGAGVLLTLGAFIGATFLLGQAAFANLTYLEYGVGVLFIVFGVLVLADRAPSLTVPLPRRRSSVLGFGIFGAGYALAAAGCVAPFFLSVISAAMTYPPADAALVVATYVGSVVVLMISLTVATGMGLVAGGGWLTAHRRRLVQLAGVVLVAAGIGQLYVAYYYSQPV